MIRQTKEFYENLIRQGKEEESNSFNTNQDDYDKSVKEKKFERAERKYKEQKQNAVL